MYRDEQVGAGLAGFVDAIAQHQKPVAVTGQIGLEAGLLVEPLRQRPCDGQHGVFFEQTAGTAGAGVLPAVTGIDGDDDVAAGWPLR